MVPLSSLWLPILVSAVLVFIASSVIHMVLGYHAADWKKLPSDDAEKAVQDALRRANVPPGDYRLPWATTSAEMNSPEFRAKGPVVVMTTWPAGQYGMGKSLVLWFLYGIVVSVFAGYIAGSALGPGARYLEVFRFAGTVGFAAYSLALMQDSIWYHRRWATTLRSMADGLLYGLLIAGVFGWLWPR